MAGDRLSEPLRVARGEIEPGEWEPVYFDFALDGDVEKVSIYTHLTNPAKQDSVGWGNKPTLDLRERVEHGKATAATPA